MTAPLPTSELAERVAGQSFAPAHGSAARSYGTIVADPPWAYDEGFANNPKPGQKGWKPLPYPSMTVEAICALPVAALAASDCRLWLWTTNRYLPHSFGVMKAWGFDYKQTVVWHKVGNPGRWEIAATTPMSAKMSKAFLFFRLEASQCLL